MQSIPRHNLQLSFQMIPKHQYDMIPAVLLQPQITNTTLKDIPQPPTGFHLPRLSPRTYLVYLATAGGVNRLVRDKISPYLMYIHEIEPFFSIDLCFISQACYLPKYIVSYCEGHQTYFKSLNSNESSEAQKSNLTQLCVFKHVYGNTGNKGYFNYCLLSVKLGYFWSICRIFSQPKQGEFRLSPEKNIYQKTNPELFVRL